MRRFARVGTLAAVVLLCLWQIYAYQRVEASGTSEYYEPSERARLEALMAAEPDCCRLIETVKGYRIYEVRLGQ